MITTVFFILAAVTFYDHKKESLVGQLKTSASRITQNLAINAGAPLLNSDEMQLSVLVFTELKNPGVISAAILDHEGKALIHSDINKIGNQVPQKKKPLNRPGTPDTNTIKEIKPIVVNGKKIGSALLTMDTSLVLETTRKLKIGLLSAILVLSGLGCFFIINVIGNFLEPLGALTEAAVKVGKGDLSARVLESGGEEIKKLGRVFNRMTEDIAHANRQTEEGYLQSVMALTAAVEAKDPYTRGHCDRVAYYSEQVALYMGMEKNLVRQLSLAGQLHDLGKIGVDKEVLCKQGNLTSKEFCHIARHPMIAWQILEPAVFLSKVRDIIIVHHERFDGKGYPNGLAGDQTCLAGKILAVADSYDAMTSNRPYRKQLSEKKALKIIREEKGKQFDPRVVDSFLEAHAGFEDRDSLDERLEISARGRVWEYEKTGFKADVIKQGV